MKSSSAAIQCGNGRGVDLVQNHGTRCTQVEFSVAHTAGSLRPDTGAPVASPMWSPAQGHGDRVHAFGSVERNDPDMTTNLV